MTLLFLFVAALAGVVVLVYEKRLKNDGLAKMQNYLMQVVNDSKLLEREKMTYIIDLFTQNNYKIEDMRNSTLIASRREFSVGAALLWFSVAGVGFAIYLVYYFLKTPETLRVDLHTGTIYED